MAHSQSSRGGVRTHAFSGDEYDTSATVLYNACVSNDIGAHDACVSVFVGGVSVNVLAPLPTCGCRVRDTAARGHDCDGSKYLDNYKPKPFLARKLRITTVQGASRFVCVRHVALHARWLQVLDVERVGDTAADLAFDVPVDHGVVVDVPPRSRFKHEFFFTMVARAVRLCKHERRVLLGPFFSRHSLFFTQQSKPTDYERIQS